MPSRGATPSLPQHLERFLHALAGTERNGMELSVLSLLARLGKDPWAEAMHLAKLPTVAAAESLAGAIASLPGNSQSPAQARATAFSLIQLLPGRAKSSQNQATPGKPARGRVATILAYGGTLGAALVFGVLLAATLQVSIRKDPSGSVAAPTLPRIGGGK